MLKHKQEMDALFQEHRARVALLPAHAHATSIMSSATIHAATQSNLVRVQGLMRSCKQYAADVEAARLRHVAEEAQERGADVNKEIKS